MDRYLGEFLGTFGLIFAGTGAMAVNDVSHAGLALTFGLIVMTMICAVGDVSGAHLNAACSLAPVLLSGNLGHLWIYLTAPFLGAALAIGSCRLMRTADCCTMPDILRREYGREGL